MFFYLFHHINHYVFKPTNKPDSAMNVRTLIMGGIAYILFHAYLKSERMSDFYFKDYFWCIFVIDVIAMGIIYKEYYGESVLGEVDLTFGKNNKNKADIQMRKLPKTITNDNKSYFNEDIESVMSEGSDISQTPTITSRKSKNSRDRSIDMSTEVDIDKIIEDAKSM
jgi:hypothetical protein